MSEMSPGCRAAWERWRVKQVFDAPTISEALKIGDHRQEEAFAAGFGAALAAVRQMRSVIAAEVAYYESEEEMGPIYRYWEDGEIGNWDDYEWDWERTLDACRNEVDCPTVEYLATGTVNVWPVIQRYRAMRAALAATEEDAKSPRQDVLNVGREVIERNRVLFDRLAAYDAATEEKADG